MTVLIFCFAIILDVPGILALASYMAGKKLLILVLCFNLLSFGGRELSSKYKPHPQKK